MWVVVVYIVFFFKQNTAYKVRIRDWSSDVCLPISNPFDQVLDDPAGQWCGVRLCPVAPDRGRYGPIHPHHPGRHQRARGRHHIGTYQSSTWLSASEIGRATCRERLCQYVEISVVAGTLKKKRHTRREASIKY